MPRRIDIELTSSRDDGSWTWRAVGAKEPKGSLAGAILPAGSKVGDVLRVDAEFFVDGIEVTGVVPSKATRAEPERLELLAPTREEPLVTSTVTAKGRDDRRPRRDGPPRRDGDRRDRGERGDRKERSDRPSSGERREGSRPPRRTRPEPPPMPAVERPKSKRLKAGRVHRTALLESLPEEQRPVAEQLVLGGLPGVRQAIDKQNAERTAAGEPAISAAPLLEMAEKLVSKVRAAEWRDRAEAAQRDIAVVDLRDLRSVVSAADAAARDDETRALAASLRQGLATRVDEEQAAWLAELAATLEVGRIVRALRVSSRPPKAGAPLPPEMAQALTDQASAALTADAPAERWVAVLDALAFSPVRDKVIPASVPAPLHEDVRATIARLATRIPKLAHIFEIAPDRNAPRPKTERRRPKKAASKPAPAARKDAKPKAEDPPKPDAAPTTDETPDIEGGETTEVAETESVESTEVAETASTDSVETTEVAEHADIEVEPSQPEAPAIQPDAAIQPEAVTEPQAVTEPEGEPPVEESPPEPEPEASGVEDGPPEVAATPSADDAPSVPDEPAAEAPQGD